MRKLRLVVGDTSYVLRHSGAMYYYAWISVATAVHHLVLTYWQVCMPPPSLDAAGPPSLHAAAPSLIACVLTYWQLCPTHTHMAPRTRTRHDPPATCRACLTMPTPVCCVSWPYQSIGRRRHRRCQRIRLRRRPLSQLLLACCR